MIRDILFEGMVDRTQHTNTMLSNAYLTIVAQIRELGLFITSVISDKLFLGFITGAFSTMLLTGFMLSKDPRHIPIILRYSLYDSFIRLAPKDRRGVVKMAFTEFIKLYAQTRALFLLSFIAFCVMVTTIAFTYKPTA